MPAYVAMLRGVNVGARNTIKMKDLEALVAGLGHTNVATYIQSGNVVFDSRSKSASALAAGIARAIREEIGLDVGVLLRSQAELAELVPANPFLRAGADLTKLHVTFLDGKPDAAAVRALAGFDAAPDEFRARGREIYLHCPAGYGQTKLNNGFWERKLRVGATTRKWKTVTTLLELSGSR